MASLVIPRKLQRSRKQDETFALESARHLLELMPTVLGFECLAGLKILDVGCGAKFSQVLLNDQIDIGEYRGLDAYRPVIEYLDANVDDPRFSYAHVDFHNARYNPGGVPMTSGASLPAPREHYDIICLFSVFTHLDPTDFRAMHQVLRPHVAASGRLFYTAFIDELTADGHGLIDAYERAVGPGVAGQTVDYRDFTPDDPLRQTLYTEEFARRLIEGTGWEVEQVRPPTKYAEHQFILRPVAAE